MNYEIKGTWLGLALALVATPVVAQDITIAVVGPMTGALASIGEQQKRGAEAAAAVINDKGGVAGKKIKIVIEDDQCDPKQAVTVANRIVGNQVKYVAGHACSGASIAAADVYNENSVLMATPASSNPVLTEKGYPTILRLYGRDDAQGAFIGPWIAKTYAGKKFVVIHDKGAYGKGLATVVKETANAAGLKDIFFEGITPGEKDYSAVVSKLKAAGADVVYFGGYHAEAGLILRQASDAGYKFTLIMGDSLATAEFWSISGPAGEGTLFTFPTDPRRSPNAVAALAKFKEQKFEPEGFTLFSYAVVEAIAEGVKRAGADNAGKVAAALKDGKPFETVLGSIALDKKGDIKDPSYDINKWHEGKYAPIAP
ncbi:branched-chain amino acid ABC transporter substrate-binding protein [Siculibacillus lacustris]|uniref:Branched-chain amino acid ABC transporter substrate-binding protein n=1 Tax=Siculibacillus lacustris TaxID=1549641 RepID=A0A4Q9VSW3_9HYPH|nr:branched-chain amino acid ABC transporter substrate-binding protein [Siculibacillus lacustris]TBW38756.1 branched-chain amino acid ABC transporter substrate-binding protein [Siculibacillus lacustris]